MLLEIKKKKKKYPPIHCVLFYHKVIQKFTSRFPKECHINDISTFLIIYHDSLIILIKEKMQPEKCMKVASL